MEWGKTTRLPKLGSAAARARAATFAAGCGLLAACMALTLATAATGAAASAAGSNPTSAKPATAPTPPAAPTPPEPGAQSSVLPDRFAGAAGRYYRMVWGIEALSVKIVESGQIVRFSWRVIDPELAKPLNDKRATPALVDPGAGVSLVVPTMEQIGQLRQTQPPEAGKSYWMAFSNKGRYVKPGHRVNVVIGGFHADGLVVD